MAIKVHDDYYVLINSTKFTHLESVTLNIGQETIDITSMDSSNEKDFNVGDQEWSLDLEAFYDPAAAEGGDEAIDDLQAGTSHTLLVSSEVSGDTTFSGSAYPTSVSIAASKGSGVKVSVSYQGTGTLTKGTVA